MDFTSIFWAILGLILIIAEFFIPGLVVIFFGIGALLTALITALIPGLSSLLIPQVLMLMGFSTLALVSMRRFFRKIFTGRQLGKHAHDYDDSAERAKVLEEISPDKAGRIEYQGTSWRALSFEGSYKPGQTVWILKKEGMTYYVGEPLLPEMGESEKHDPLHSADSESTE